MPLVHASELTLLRVLHIYPRSEAASSNHSYKRSVAANVNTSFLQLDNQRIFGLGLHLHANKDMLINKLIPLDGGVL